MRKKALFIFSITLVFNIIYSQKIPPDFIKKFNDIHVIKNEGNKDAAKKKLFEFIELCKKKNYFNLASYSHNTLGQIYESEGNIFLAKNEFVKGIEIGKTSDTKSGLAINIGSLGRIERDLNMRNSGSKKIEEAIHLLENDTTGEEDVYRDITLGDLYTWMSYSTNDILTNEKKIEIAESYYQRIPSQYFNKTVILSFAYINFANIELKFRRYNKGLHYLELAQQYNKTMHVKRIASAIHMEIVRSFVLKKDYTKAILYGEKSLKYIDAGDDTEKLNLLGYLSSAYQATGNKEVAQQYRLKYLEIENRLDKNKLLTSLNINSDKDASNPKQVAMKWPILILLGILISFSLYTFCSTKLIIREKKNFKTKALATIEENKKIIMIMNVVAKESINIETEKKIVKGLNDFERKLQFSQKGITQGALATQLNTNWRYLSLIIRKHKDSNFSSYINKLRIKHIIQKIEEDPEFKKYKVSYLAEYSGFSTPGLFTKAFREIAGVTPSVYKDLTKEEKEKIFSNLDSLFKHTSP